MPPKFSLEFYTTQIKNRQRIRFSVRLPSYLKLYSLGVCLDSPSSLFTSNGMGTPTVSDDLMESQIYI